MMEPVVKEVRVAAGVEDAFRRFTEEIGRWWPTGSHSVSQERCRDVRFGTAVGETVEEAADDGTVHVWGRITAWDPPTRVAFTWHPGRAAETAQEVVVTFQSDGEGTRVRLVHSGWEKLGEGADAKRSEYHGGWDFVLRCYTEEPQRGGSSPG